MVTLLGCGVGVGGRGVVLPLQMPSAVAEPLCTWSCLVEVVTSHWSRTEASALCKICLYYSFRDVT